VTTSPEALRLPARGRISRRRTGGLALGISTVYLSLIVLLPIAAVVAASLDS
jgi:ABC-type sulfate transport system permease component